MANNTRHYLVLVSQDNICRSLSIAMSMLLLPADRGPHIGQHLMSDAGDNKVFLIMESHGVLLILSAVE